MEKPKVIVEYRDKKNSSGKVVDGTIKLSISSRLSTQEKERHINTLTDRLVHQMNWAQRYRFEPGEGLVRADTDLQRLANAINKAYYNLPLDKASFHQQSSTWGTCSIKTRHIYISHRLIGAPMDFIWYVVTHELCHLAVPAHNGRFWDLVGKACPNYQEVRKKLKAFALQKP